MTPALGGCHLNRDVEPHHSTVPSTASLARSLPEHISPRQLARPDSTISVRAIRQRSADVTSGRCCGLAFGVLWACRRCGRSPRDADRASEALNV